VIISAATLFRGNSASARHGIDTASLLRGNLRKILSSHFTFSRYIVCYTINSFNADFRSSVPQMFIGVMLLYTMRQFERQVAVNSPPSLYLTCVFFSWGRANLPHLRFYQSPYLLLCKWPWSPPLPPWESIFQCHRGPIF
jgi:hypothetical protein